MQSKIEKKEFNRNMMKKEKKQKKQIFQSQIRSPRIEGWKRVGKKLLFPHWFIKLVLVIVSVLALFYAFATPNPIPAVTYSGYTLSAYTLVAAVAEVPAIAKKVKGRLYANKYSNKYLTEPELRAMISLYTGVGINILYAVIKVAAGCYYKSYWLGGIGAYYMVLSLIRFGLVRGERFCSKKENEWEQRMYGLKCYRFCGWLTLLLNIVVSGLVIQLIWRNETYSYPGLLVFAFATFAFYSFIIAVINVAKYRKMENPVLSAAKMLSLACAMVSILALQTALLTEFSEAGQENFARIMNVITGSTVCFLIFVMAIWMICRANREIEKMKPM